MADAVLDASAILALILEEPGAGRVEPHVPGGTASAVNIGEVVVKLRDLGMVEAEVDEIITEMQLDVRGHDLTAALATGHLRPATRSAGFPWRIGLASRWPGRFGCPPSRPIAAGSAWPMRSAYAST